MSNTYQLLDSGNFEKLEQVGPYRLVRPAPQAIWKPQKSTNLWNAANAVYERSSSGGGEWHYKTSLPDEWLINFGGLRLKIKPTNFGHLGLFAEQEENWAWIARQIKSAPGPIKVLNTFAYTGGSSLAAAQAGASVTHLDASKGIVAWARENAAVAGLSHKPIRWLVEDVSKFIAREIRRGNAYEAIILDPPSFGRGSKGEVWKFENDLPKLLELCLQILSPNPRFILLSAHTPGFTPLALENLLGDMMNKYGGQLSSKEMTIAEKEGGRVLPSGSMARWTAETGD